MTELTMQMAPTLACATQAGSAQVPTLAVCAETMARAGADTLYKVGVIGSLQQTILK